MKFRINYEKLKRALRRLEKSKHVRIWDFIYYEYRDFARAYGVSLTSFISILLCLVDKKLVKDVLMKYYNFDEEEAEDAAGFLNDSLVFYRWNLDYIVKRPYTKLYRGR